ncbi:MAG: isocitrate lyase/phosphoenolpyruvate mutase family protein [Gemmatimonadetes bacterium]|nr:isocitrate lyase/phosphoenolpyruvate mutase family protein [Gemmatimonadota bacterium]
MISKTEQKRKAATLLSLHDGGDLLILPNIWDPIGARILEVKGYPAVATASAAISASLGYQDGEKIKRQTVIDVIGRIARSVTIPLTADIEAGYGSTLSELEDTARAVIEAGVVGVNLEDGLEDAASLRPIDDQCARIATMREAAARHGIHLVINARPDSFLSSSFESKAEAAEDAVARAEAYARAGADCIYPVGPGDEETVRELRARISSPINILGSPSAAPLPVLQSIGVNRVSFGPFPFRSLLAKFAGIADTLKQKGDYSCIADRLTGAEVGAYLLDGPE